MAEFGELGGELGAELGGEVGAEEGAGARIRVRGPLNDGPPPPSEPPPSSSSIRPPRRTATEPTLTRSRTAPSIRTRTAAGGGRPPEPSLPDEPPAAPRQPTVVDRRVYAGKDAGTSWKGQAFKYGVPAVVAGAVTAEGIHYANQRAGQLASTLEKGVGNIAHGIGDAMSNVGNEMSQIPGELESAVGGLEGRLQSGLSGLEHTASRAASSLGGGTAVKTALEVAAVAAFAFGAWRLYKYVSGRGGTTVNVVTPAAA